MAEGTRFPVMVVEELVGAVPALVERTRAQIELTQNLVGRMPCLLRWTASDHERPTPVEDVTAVDDERAPARAAAGGATVRRMRPPGREEGGTAPAGPTPTGPLVGDLAIPDYDSLAASQVVPRLASLDAAELADVGLYEREHRGRQTILNRVRQLQTAEGR